MWKESGLHSRVSGSFHCRHKHGVQALYVDTTGWLNLVVALGSDRIADLREIDFQTHVYKSSPNVRLEEFTATTEGALT